MRRRPVPIRYAIVPAALLASLVACSDGAGPPTGGEFEERKAPPWKTAESSQEASDTGSFDDWITAIWGDTVAYSELTVITHAPYAPPLETYDTSFTVIVGRPTSFRIHYQHSGGWARPPVFMEITIPRDARLVDHDGAVHAKGDSVEIDVEIDRERFEFQLEPHGSTFTGRKPVTLWISLAYADFRTLSPELLRVWYQATEVEEWITADTEIDSGFLSLRMKLRHFSGYAVAW